MQAELLLLLAAHLVMTALPGVAITLWAMRRGVRSVPVLLAIGLATTGAVAMLAFWAYYADKTLGQSFSYFVLFGSVLLAVTMVRGGDLDRHLLRQLATPLALWALGSTFLVLFGFLYGGTHHAIATGSIRFYGPLPSDNDLPRYFSEWFYAHGHNGRPGYPPDWLASDRPPLQIGYVLAQRPFAFVEPALHYQVIGVLLQQLWIVGLWALLLAARVGRLTRALIVIAVLLSPLAIVNGFYVWPKLLPAAMLLAAAALVLTPLWDELRRKAWVGGLVGLLLGLAMMGHGSSVFGVIPLALVAAFRGMPSRRWIGAAALIAFVVMAPWSAYQKYGEPPGNRLLKWSLAGVTEIDERGTVETIVDSYREVGMGGAIHDKGQNFVTMFGGGPAWEALKRGVNDLGSGDFAGAVREARTIFFFDVFPSLGFLLIAPFAMLLGRRRVRAGPEWSFALTCFTVVAVGCLVWGLLAFGDLPSRTVLHVGSYALPILAFAGAVAGLRATFARLALWLVVANCVFTLALYVPNLDPLPGSSFSPVSALLVVLSLAGFLALALRPPPAGAPARGPVPQQA